MPPTLTQEQSAAIDASDSGSLEVIDPLNNRTYVIVDSTTHRQAMDALREKQRREDHAAIAEGIAEMETGKGMPIEDARRLSRERLLSREK